MTGNFSDSNFFKIHREGESFIIRASGDFTISNAAQISSSLDIEKLLHLGSSFSLDLSGIKTYDTYLAIFLEKFRSIPEDKEVQIKIAGLSPEAEQFIDKLIPKSVSKPQKEKVSPFVAYFDVLGTKWQLLITDAIKFIEFIGELFVKLLALIPKPGAMRWKDFPDQYLKSGVNALPITALIIFLIGLITGYQGALELKKFGADVFIADLIGISITRELAPLMAAILVAGRSGSAFAAELGTMKVSEEIDSIVTMGFDEFRFLVLPRVLAVTLAMPFLVLICDAVGVIGGIIAGITTLDVTIAGFISRLLISLRMSDILTGVFKSGVFGFLVAALGCYKGLQVRGGAAAVGKFTTASVVAGVFLIILSDAVFTLVFQVLGI